MAVSMYQVLLMALALLVLTFAIGCIPIYWISKTKTQDQLSLAGEPSHSKYIAVFSQFGVGMLLGTSFMLVIPEGITECLEHNGNVGLNLLIGFLLVYTLDRMVQSIVGKSENDGANGPNSGRADILFESWKDLLRNPRQVCQAILRNNVVFALFIHGLSDGIALGTTVNNDSLLIVMLIAIVIHKIPAVLSLSSLMISRQNLPKWEAISNLFAFAASTPIGYIALSMFNLKHSETMSWLSGNLLLMSGGSLLYASFTAFVSDSGHSHTHNYSDVNANDEYPLQTNTQGPLFDDRNEMDNNWDPRRYNIVPDNLSETGQISEPDMGAVTTNPSNEMFQSSHSFPRSASWLDADESIFTLAGVILPVVISFLIKE